MNMRVEIEDEDIDTRWEMAKIGIMDNQLDERGKGQRV